ncbi:hypothetical protein ACP70R_006580 [Stipagrostis hirtigluma subsp. patula]
MLLWNGDRLLQDFTQEEMDIFGKKIYSRLLHSEFNKERRASYENPITESEYLSKAKKHTQDDATTDEVIIISKEDVKKNATKQRAKGVELAAANGKRKGQTNQEDKKRERAQIVEGKSMGDATKHIPKSPLTIAQRVKSTNRRPPNPSQYNRIPYISK